MFLQGPVPRPGSQGESVDCHLAVGGNERHEQEVDRIRQPTRETFCEGGLYVLVGAGALMMAVGFFGCCGAMRESQCVLGSFFTCLLVIFAAEVTTGVFAFIGKGVAIRHVQTMYEEAYIDYLKDREKGNGTLITFHSTFQCCGKESSEQVQPTCPKELLGPKVSFSSRPSPACSVRRFSHSGGPA
ncbi:Tetraspanin-2 [Pteropus alecto]|uniref:Tetraspanin-2 n=1 Tax=Pteropus alecto TaxID=9402 RepID=L5K3N7_PTEAL|nr:Tetraspanin-2 [Pteropus alecto]